MTDIRPGRPPAAVHLFACGTDNDGAPTCMGDGGMCGYDAVAGRQVCDRLEAQ